MRLTVFATGFIIMCTPSFAEYTKTDHYHIGEREVPYQIKQGQNTESGTVKYLGYISKFERETGRPSTITHIIDDRQCEWIISGHIDRVVCFRSIMGGESCNNNLSKSTPISISGGSNGIISFLDHDPCTDYAGKIDSDINKAKNELMNHFTKLTDDDLNGDLKRTLSGSGVTVTYDQ